LRIEANHLPCQLYASFICCCRPRCRGSGGDKHFGPSMVRVQQPVRMLFGLSKKNIQSTRSWCMHKCHFLSPRCLRCQFHCCHPSVFVPPISLLPPFSVCLCQCHLLVDAAHFIFCQPWHCTACSFLASCNVCTVKFHFLPWPVLRPQFHFLYPIVFAPVFVGQYFQCHFLPPI